MAILKFRAWHIKAKKYFECVGFTDDVCLLLISKLKDKIFPHKRGGFVIEQSTGLHDSFGAEIYEGDLVKTHEDSERPYVVIWVEKYGGWGLAMSDKGAIPLGSSKRFSAIGNINQHPNIIPHYDPRTTH